MPEQYLIYWRYGLVRIYVRKWEKYLFRQVLTCQRCCCINANRWLCWIVFHFTVRTCSGKLTIYVHDEVMLRFLVDASETKKKLLVTIGSFFGIIIVTLCIVLPITLKNRGSNKENNRTTRMTLISDSLPRVLFIRNRRYFCVCFRSDNGFHPVHQQCSDVNADNKCVEFGNSTNQKCQKSTYLF